MHTLAIRETHNKDCSVFGDLFGNFTKNFSGGGQTIIASGLKRKSLRTAWRMKRRSLDLGEETEIGLDLGDSTEPKAKSDGNDQ